MKEFVLNRFRMIAGFEVGSEDKIEIYPIFNLIISIRRFIPTVTTADRSALLNLGIFVHDRTQSDSDSRTLPLIPGGPTNESFRSREQGLVAALL